MSNPHTRRAQHGARPSHPSGAAFLLIIGITIAVVVLAAVTTFGLG